MIRLDVFEARNYQKYDVSVRIMIYNFELATVVKRPTTSSFDDNNINTRYQKQVANRKTTKETNESKSN